MDTWIVYTNGDKKHPPQEVKAKVLYYKNYPLKESSSAYYLVHSNFNLIEWMDHFKSKRVYSPPPVPTLMTLVAYAKLLTYRTLMNFTTGGPYDVQRIPDEKGIKDGRGFVQAFIGAGSFVYGVAGCLLGVDIYELVVGGGIQNIKNNADEGVAVLNGAWGNNERNVRNMRLGYFFAQDPDRYCENQDHYINAVMNTEPTGLLDPVYDVFMMTKR